MTRLRVSLSLGAASTLLFFANGASAQSGTTDFDVPQFYGRGKNTSVLERDRSEYQAIGVHAGAFTVYPKLNVGVSSTDNVYPGANTAALKNKSDQYATIAPSVFVASDWSRHSLSGSASVLRQEYSKFSTENSTGWDVRGNARLDVHADSYINLGGDAQRVYEARGSQNSISTASKPIPLDTQGAYVRGLYSADRVRTAVDLDYRNFDYKNVPGALFEDTRDFEQKRASLRADFALSPDTAIFAKVAGAQNKYRQGTSTGVITDKRDSSEFRALTGANFDLSDVARGEIGVGYVSRDYDSVFFKDVKGVAVAAKIEYFPTQLITVTGVAQRSVQDAAFSRSGGYFQNTVSVSADYELRRNFIVSAAAGYERDEFQGVDRSDKVANVGLGARYLVNRSFGIGASVSYADRKSSGAAATIGPQFNVTRIGLSLVFQR
ncbi:outer membrane beta-barrel protein [Phenylobacterium sp. 20VBR1]|nr:outer membrane beta-barrel protein [Phenylobacterium glaciei]MBR7619200.1 outer membrane beta-barrel protein [Phenylobacterium glaciei]